MTIVTVQDWRGYVLGQVVLEESHPPFDFNWHNPWFILYEEALCGSVKELGHTMLETGQSGKDGGTKGLPGHP
jgi:hypothetical protein